MKLWPCATARANKSIGKRLTLSFPKAIDQRVIVLALPSEGHLAFGVESVEGVHELVLEAFDSVSLAESRPTQTIAEFESKSDAVAALKKVRRALTRPLRRALGWALALFLFAMVIQWAVSFAMTAGASPRQSGAYSSAPTQSQGVLTPDQIAVLQQSMAARGGLANAPAGAPEMAPPGAAAPAAAPNGSGASIYQNPAQPQDPTGGVLNQLNNSR